MNFNEFKEKYRLTLTEAQIAACSAVGGYTLLLAVPGSGKTTVLISRLGYMIYALGIDPQSILTMTYTVAATHDMRERFCSVFGEEMRERLEFRTINGVCAKIIAGYERMTGGKAFSLVTDEKVRPKWDDGTPAYTKKLFGVVNRYDLSEDFPLITLRPISLRSAVDEILWIWQKKSNNIHDLGSHI